jgi:hypothetical protein
MATLFNTLLTNCINKRIFKLGSKSLINNVNINDIYKVQVYTRNFIISSRYSQKPNINIGTIGHIDHGLIYFLNAIKFRLIFI